MTDIVLVTCERWPALSTSDLALATELRALGARVRSEPWNVAPTDAFTSADAVVLRSNWDFHHDPAAFERWLEVIAASRTTLHNPPGLVRAYLDKTYLDGLAAAGFPTPRTLITTDFDVDTILGWMADQGLDRVVTKPVWGASGHGVELLATADIDRGRERWRADRAARPMLVQEFIPDVADGEHALVFFAGEYSHALLRRPGAGDFRVNSQYGGTLALADTVEPAVIEFAAKIEATLPEPATYVRIDVVDTANGPVVMEVEVNEPALGLDLAPGAAARFAAAVVSR